MADAQKLSIDPHRTHAVSVNQDGRRIWVAQLLGEDEQVLNLASEDVLGGCYKLDENDDVDLKDGQKPETGNTSVWLIARDDATSREIMRCKGEILSHEEAIVRFVLQPNTTVLAGIYEAQIGLFLDGDPAETLIRTWPALIDVLPNMFKTQNDRGAITLEWVRTAIRDFPDCENLNEEVEFSDVEILHCVRRAVDKYNQTPPFVDSIDTHRFPDREPLLTGITAYLYQTGAAWYRRNNLNYSVAGGNVQDRNRAAEYEQKSQELLDRYTLWCSQFKMARDSRNYWGIL